MPLTAKQDKLVADWVKAKNELDSAKAIEAELRRLVAVEVYGYDENALKSGTENIELGAGFKLKGEFKLNHTLNNKDDAVDKMLSKLEKSREEGKFIAERLVKFKPELSVTEYKNLTPKLKAIVDTVVTVKSSMPTITLVEAKAKA